jgi:hypothetical protein
MNKKAIKKLFDEVLNDYCEATHKYLCQFYGSVKMPEAIVKSKVEKYRDKLNKLLKE